MNLLNYNLPFDKYFIGILESENHLQQNKRDRVTRFSTIFFAQKIRPGQAKTVLRNFSFSQRNSIAKFENRVSTLSTTMRILHFFFRYRDFLF